VLRVDVDATDLPRKLLRSRIQVDAEVDTLALLYPKWIPGIHAPRGPVENVAGFVPRDAEGNVLAWARDWAAVFRFLVPLTQTAGPVTVDLTYITNQPSTNSRGIDAFGYRTLGIINWNTILLYPEGAVTDEMEVQLTLTLSAGWQAGSAIPVKERRDNRITFEPLSLTRLVDSPLVCGLHDRQVELARTDVASYLTDIVADEAKDLPADSLLQPLGDLVLESEELFGPTLTSTAITSCSPSVIRCRAWGSSIARVSSTRQKRTPFETSTGRRMVSAICCPTNGSDSLGLMRRGQSYYFEGR
jgi:predicted metalloprotease with PDZ domain